MMTFDIPLTLLIGVLVATVLPLLVGLVTTRVTKAGTRAVLLAVLSAATGLLTELGAALTQGVTYNVGIGLLTALAAFLTAVGLHYGLYKPTGTAEKLQAVGGQGPRAPQTIGTAHIDVRDTDGNFLGRVSGEHTRGDHAAGGL